MNLGNQSESKNILTLENVEKNVYLLDLFVVAKAFKCFSVKVNSLTYTSTRYDPAISWKNTVKFWGAN